MANIFKALSLSYKTAPIHIREAVALDEHTSARLLELLKDYTSITEVLVLSTCNRTEIYYSSAEDLSNELVKLIGVVNSIGNIDNVKPFFTAFSEPEMAIKHLFAVALGLESQVVGDIQISNQVKKAYKNSVEAGLAGPFLHRLMHSIFAASKRVQQETCFRDGAASVSYATVDLVKELTKSIGDPQILIVGVGEIGTDVCKNLHKAGFKNIKVSNRTLEKTQVLQAQCGVEVVSWKEISAEIKNADVIISAVPGIQPFFTPEGLENLATFSTKFFIDLSIPRSMAAEIEEIPGVLLYNVDDIKAKATVALERRKAAIPQVKTIITEATNDFSKWSSEMNVLPVIQEFKNALEDIRTQEMKRFLKNASNEENEKVDLITRSIVQKILKLPVLQLKSACQRGEAEQMSQVLRMLFDLEQKVNN